LHVACSVQNGKLDLAAVVCCDVNVDLIFVTNFRYKLIEGQTALHISENWYATSKYITFKYG